MTGTPNKVNVKIGRPTTKGEIAQLVAVEDVGSNPTQVKSFFVQPQNYFKKNSVRYTQKTREDFMLHTLSPH